ncbi:MULTISPECIES: DUF952 domain-containing protein [Amycolatopsis]|uniref:DUF952 domain-containing protein n=1 Tax=Amycolatopsis dendrobii TaxID=2760662 RepID=A0A7W3W0N8_9PSEU|nr:MULTISPECIES: DUF952 domain-containing protein [Amycolatopsis]MBB1156698.1 DUF952 domain-containing protein [Amycolatopsis dendrobii]UKD53409.1 DUF952 domain-containing protein [Amycolatopsis sp. FU40]
MILHICTRAEWAEVPAGGEYRASSLDDAEFIHCSDPGTVALPANAVFRGQSGLVLLEIDPELVDAPVRWEDGDPPDPRGIQFPHIYGPIPRNAVVAVHDFPPDTDGAFKLPESLSVR